MSKKDDPRMKIILIVCLCTIAFLAAACVSGNASNSEVSKEAGFYYTVLAGDSISGLSAKFNVPQEVIVSANGLTGRLNVGDVLFIPGAKENKN